MPCVNPLDVQAWTGGMWGADLPSDITGVCHDSRVVTPGDMYIAIKGVQFDGHDFLHDAFQKGAVAAMVQADYAAHQDGSYPLLSVKDTHEGLMDLARGYRGVCQAQIVAVTGSVGKTTVKEMLADILATQGPCARTPGNWNNDIGLPLSLLAMDPNDTYGVFELGMNHPGELDPLCAVLKPHYAVVTAVGPVHMEFFDSVKGIAIEKAALLRALPEDGLAVLDVDGAWFDVLRKNTTCPLVTTSMDPHATADFVAVRAKTNEGFLCIQERTTGAQVELHLTVPGDFAAADALLAVAMARSMGIDFKSIQQALQAFHPVGMRWKCMEINGVTLINDAYNANPLSMAAALQTAGRMTNSGRKWLVLGSMFELGDYAFDAHLSLGHQVAEGNWAGLIAVGTLGKVIAQGAQEKGFETGKIFCCETAADAGHIMKSMVEPKDLVLLKASRTVRLEDALKTWQADA